MDADPPRPPTEMNPSYGDNLMRLIRFLDEPRLRVGDMDISYRQVNYWEEKGLLLGKQERDSHHAWRAFSLVDYYWIRMAVASREWGISFTVLQALREAMEEASPGPLMPAGQAPRALSFLLSEFVVTRLNLNLLISRAGAFTVFNPANQDVFDPSVREFLDRDHLSLSLAAIMRSTLLEHGPNHLLCRLPGLLSAGETALFRDLKLGVTRWVGIIPLEQTLHERKRTGEGPDADLLRFYIDHLVGWPYERIEYRNDGGAVQTLTWREWSLRLEETGGLPGAEQIPD